MHDTIVDKTSEMLVSFGAVCLLPHQVRYESKITSRMNILFGMGRNATGSSAFPRERRAMLERLPGDW
jgi:hypothetical protein